MALPTVTYDRMRALLDEEELNYGVQESGELTFGFTPLMVWINIDDRTLRTTGVWRGSSTTEEDGATIRAFCHKVNSSQNFPKSYPQGDGSEDAPYIFVMEHSVPLTQGLNDEQLKDYFNATMGMFFGTIEDLEKELPHLVTWSEEE
ncbi:YbjN domain-containing protein [Schaalia canis]|uniref:YbjN domain-containing protein n=1 Tax=Schaalia canis TaxID=100469 RepID=UPI0014029A3D|nr:YbjN domain-containing protein [Schaalia canis]